MEDKIEIGEYVRTETGFIRRIKSIDKIETTEECPVNMYWCNLDKPIKILKECSKDTIYAIEMNDAKKLKHFNNILDLIEDKDIVEIELSEEFVEKKDKKKLIQIGDIYTKETLQKDIDNGIITRILTILSYNQYMANCYKVGGE